MLVHSTLYIAILLFKRLRMNVILHFPLIINIIIHSLF